MSERVPKSRKGFTLVEFMVATVVFSLVMLMTSYAITSMSRMYQRSMNTSRAQATARSLVDTIAQSTQFSASSVRQNVAGPQRAYCIGQKQFIYVLGRKVGMAGGTDTRHAVVSRTGLGDAACSFTGVNIIATDPAGAVDMVGDNMRIAILDVIESGGFVTVRVKVIYGADDLLVNPADPTKGCKTGAGSEYCAVSELSTVVQRRIL